MREVFDPGSQLSVRRALRKRARLLHLLADEQVHPGEVVGGGADLGLD